MTRRLLVVGGRIPCPNGSEMQWMIASERRGAAVDVADSKSLAERAPIRRSNARGERMGGGGRWACSTEFGNRIEGAAVARLAVWMQSNT